MFCIFLLRFLFCLQQNGLLRFTKFRTSVCQRQDSTDGREAALHPADPGSNPVVSMLQHALRLSVSAGRQTQLIMNRSWSQTLIVALLHLLDYKTLQLLLLLLFYQRSV